MSGSTFSAGPWHVESSESSTTVWATRSGDDDKSIATLSHFGPQDVRADNARLIASAPELLAALQALLMACGFAKMGGAPIEAGAPVCVQARAAIAKATGESA